jgi:hypothetical protein
MKAKQIKFIGAIVKKNELANSFEKSGGEKTVMNNMDIGIIAENGRKNAKIGWRSARKSNNFIALLILQINEFPRLQKNIVHP